MNEHVVLDAENAPTSYTMEHLHQNNIWGIGGGASSVPIPQYLNNLQSNNSAGLSPSQLASQHITTNSSRDSGMSSAQQNSMSPLSFMGQENNSPAPMNSLIMGGSSDLGLSPLPNSPPSPGMWPAHDMELDDQFGDVKMELLDQNPLEDILANSNENEDSFSNILDGNNMSTVFDNILYPDMTDINEQTCLDSRHTSTASMTLVNPDEVVGISNSYGVENSSSLGFNFTKMINEGNTRNIPNMSSSLGSHPNAQLSQSFNSTLNYLRQEPTSQNNNLQQSSNQNIIYVNNVIKAENKSPDLFPSSPANSMFSSIPEDSATTFQSFTLPNDDFSNNDIRISLSDQLRPGQIFSTSNTVTPHFQNSQVNSNQQYSTSLPVSNNPTYRQHRNMVNTQLLTTGGGIIETNDIKSTLGNNYQQYPLLQKTQKQPSQKRQQLNYRSNQAHPIQIRSSNSPSTPSNTPVQQSFSPRHVANSTLRDMLQSSSLTSNFSSYPSPTTSPLNNPQSPINNLIVSNPVPPDDIFSDSFSSNFIPQQSSSQPNMQQHIKPNQRGGKVMLNPNKYKYASSIRQGHQGSSHGMINTHIQNVQDSNTPLANSIDTIHPALKDKIVWSRRERKATVESSICESICDEDTLALLASPNVHDSDDDDDEDVSSVTPLAYGEDMEALNISEQSPSVPKRRTTSTSSGSGAVKKEKFFWQYNVQAKGPKGNKVTVDMSSDPHEILTVSDPVFNSNCALQGIKHSGKARRGDGNDLEPNPMKLVCLGKQLKNLNKNLDSVPTHVDSRGMAMTDGGPPTDYKKEKNKLASRICRMKKKAQHEANKVRLYGLQKEHEMLLSDVNRMKELLVRKYRIKTGSPMPSTSKLGDAGNIQGINNEMYRISQHKPYEIAANVTEFINCVISKCYYGSKDGGLSDLSKVMSGTRRASPLEFDMKDEGELIDDDEDLM